MSDVNDRLSTLRSLLHEGPGRWSQLCDLLVTWPEGDGLSVALEYAETHMEGWPRHMRQAPPRWWHELGLGRVSPAWSLMRTLALPLGGVPVHEALERLPLLADVARFVEVHVQGRVELEQRAWEAFFASPTLQGVERLDMERVNAAEAFANTTGLGAVTRLAFRDCGLTSSMGSALLDASAFGTLHTLDLSLNPGLGASPVVDALASRERLAALTNLSLEGCLVGASGLQALARSPHLGRLERLNLCNAQLTVSGEVHLPYQAIYALAQAPWVANLVALDLAENELGSFGGAQALALVGGQYTARLKHLNLKRTGIDAEGLTALAASPLLRGVVSLDLRANNVGPEGAQALANLPEATLEELELSFNAIEDAGVVALASSPSMRRLKRLILYRNYVTEAGAVALARSPHLTNLEELQLGFNAVGDAGVAALVEADNLQGLKRLGLSHNQIGTPGAVAIAQAPLVRRLDTLALQQNRIGEKGIRALTEALAGRSEMLRMLPEPQVTWEEGEPDQPEPTVGQGGEQRASELREILQRLLGDA